MNKALVFAFTAMIGTGLMFLSGCSIRTSDANKPYISREMLDEKADELPKFIQDYFEEKYGQNIKTSIIYQGVAGGTFLGSTEKDELYHHIKLNVYDGDLVSECYANIHGRIIDDSFELYVKNESYYGYAIKERMEDWLSLQIAETSISNYTVNFLTASTNFYPSEYEYETSAEEIIKSVSSIDDATLRPMLKFTITVPKSEYDKHTNIDDEFTEMKSNIENLNGNLEIWLAVYTNEDYEKYKSSPYDNNDAVETIQMY